MDIALFFLACYNALKGRDSLEINNFFKNYKMRQGILSS